MGRGRERRLDEAALRVPEASQIGFASDDPMLSVTTSRLAAIAGDVVERELGDELRARWEPLFEQLHRSLAWASGRECPPSSLSR